MTRTFAGVERAERVFAVGERAERVHVVTDADVRTFAALSGDDNPVHLDDAFAASTRFGRRIAHGMLSAGLVSAVLGTQLPGRGVVYVSQALRFKAPVFVGDTVTVLVEVTAVRTDKPIVTLRTTVTTHEGVLALEGEAVTWTADVAG